MGEIKQPTAQRRMNDWRGITGTLQSVFAVKDDSTFDQLLKQLDDRNNEPKTNDLLPD